MPASKYYLQKRKSLIYKGGHFRMPSSVNRFSEVNILRRPSLKSLLTEMVILSVSLKIVLFKNNSSLFYMNLDEDKLYINIAAPNVIYNFVVEKFFI